MPPARRAVAAALAGYLGVLLVVAWPVVSGLTSRMQGLGDGGGMIWGFWWMRHALETGQWPFTTTMMLAPVGTPLAFHTWMPLVALVSVPVQWAVGPTVAHNLALLAAPVAAALACRALARALGQPPAGAFVAGLAFGFAPALVDRLAMEHLNVGMTFWLPLTALALRAALAPGRGRVAAVAPASCWPGRSGPTSPCWSWRCWSAGPGSWARCGSGAASAGRGAPSRAPCCPAPRSRWCWPRRSRR